MKEKTITSFDGTKIYYQVYPGKGPTLVLLHGGSGSSNSWCFLLPDFLKNEFSLIVLDQRGHGLSGRGKARNFFKIENFVRDLKAVLDEEKIDKAVLVGHSLGGQIAQKFYQQHQERVKALVLISTKFHRGHLRIFAQLTNFVMSIVFALGSNGKPNSNYTDYSSFRSSGDLNLFRIFSDINCCSFKTYAATIIEGNNFENQFYSEIKVPCLLIHGRKDMILPYWPVEKVNDEMENFELVTLGTNHITLLNEPEKINREIEEFLKEFN